jgi:hypothetical protein
MGTNLSFILAYHPQTYGKTEVVNMSLGNLLIILVTEQGHQWDHILAQSEFAFNNSMNISIGKIPFEIVYGIRLRGITELRDLNKDEFRSAGAEDFAAETQKLHDRVREQLENNSQKYKSRVDQKRREVQFEVVDEF